MHLGSSLFLSFGIPSHCTYPFRHFESPFSLLFLTFRVIYPKSYHSESQSLAFMSTVITHLTFKVLYSPSFSSPRHLMLITYSSFARPNSSFHRTRQGLLSSWHLLQSCCGAPCTWHSHIVHIGQSLSSIFFLVLQSGSTVTHLWYDFFESLMETS